MKIGDAISIMVRTNKKDLEKYVGIPIDKKEEKKADKFTDGETKSFNDKENKELWNNKPSDRIEDKTRTAEHVIYLTDADAEKFDDKNNNRTKKMIK